MRRSSRAANDERRTKAEHLIKEIRQLQRDLDDIRTHKAKGAALECTRVENQLDARKESILNLFLSRM